MITKQPVSDVPSVQDQNDSMDISAQTLESIARSRVENPHAGIQLSEICKESSRLPVEPTNTNAY